MKENFKKKLIDSDSIKSLILEKKVFNVLDNLNWETEQSPFYVDPSTNKMRELDIKARKYFKKDDYSCDIDILVECKNLKNYHIIANNVYNDRNFFDFLWLGNYTYKQENTLDQLLFKHGLKTREVNSLKEKLEDYCVVDHSYRWMDYKFQPFEIPTFNTYRETNINSTKNIDNSVIWKCINSLQSVIDAHKELLLDGLEFSIIEAINDKISKIRTLEIIEKALKNKSNHIYFFHPVIVVESKLWELNSNNTLEELKYFRFNIQRFFENSTWVDIVNANYIEEYFQKSLNYISFHKKRNFKF